MSFLMVWAIVSLIGWAIGKFVKSRPVAGFLWGLFLGPIGWVITLFISDNRLLCPHCGGTFNSNYTTCQHCGKEVEGFSEHGVNIYKNKDGNIIIK